MAITLRIDSSDYNEFLEGENLGLPLQNLHYKS